MKQILLVICFYFTTHVFVFAQQTEKLTEILIIGVNHNKTKKINYNKLYQLLEKNKPDLILWEQSEDFERVFGLRTAYRLKIFSNATEQLALQVFNKKNRLTPILGFDTSFSSSMNNIKENEIVIDIGANVGMYTLMSAIGRGAIVYGFEPEAANYNLLTQNIKLNNINIK